MNIGIAGTGRMGAAIAQRLLNLGHTVRVWNRTRERAAALEKDGAIVCATPAELAASSEVIITMLTDAAAIERTYGEADGLLADEARGKTFIEMSTVRPQTECALAVRIHAKGGAMIECPVGGTVGPAREGKLLGIVGGAAEDVERMRPLLDTLCRRWEHLGPIGAGASGKLAINLPLMVFWQAFGEALALVQHLGVDANRLVDLFADTSGGPNVLKARGKALAEEMAGGYTGPVAFDIDSMRKDLHAMIDDGKSLGYGMPITSQTLACFDALASAGLGPKDSVVIPVRFAQR
ncbi:MAG: NAD-binding protein [Betaproteobacteria bacterium]|nr:NAD-binding protein [Betaproteobacteria bacterium]